ncbi:DUF2956 domain-containing protein [Reinekea marina]|uniref:DUF2956 domain-containing protein n=2 Tax=Reinekea marina TaxID=1310421 RepID=A0ABV7WSC0_9GAMM
MKKQVSDKTQQEALQVAKATARSGQTKEQTKLIAKGVEKGIAEYKKQQKAKARERDRAKKKVDTHATVTANETTEKSGALTWLPWALLAISWLGFIIYAVLTA